MLSPSAALRAAPRWRPANGTISHGSLTKATLSLSIARQH